MNISRKRQLLSFQIDLLGYLLQAERKVLQYPAGAIMGGENVGGQFMPTKDADYIILRKQDTQKDITSDLKNLAVKQNFSVAEIEAISQDTEKVIGMNLAIELAPPQAEKTERIGEYLQRKFDDLQIATSAFVESEGVQQFKENLGKFAKAAAPVATALAFAIAPEILIPMVMGGSIAWGGVLTSGLIGVGVDYAINRGLDKLGVENQWVKLGASVIGGLMVGGGLMALKKKIGNKVAKIDTFTTKKVELLEVDRSATDLAKKNNNFVGDAINKIKDHQKTAKDLTEGITGKTRDVLDVRAVESLFGKNLKAVQGLIEKEMGSFRTTIKEKYVDLSPSLGTRGLELVKIQRKLWNQIPDKRDKSLLIGLQWRKGLFAMEQEFGDDIDNIIKLAEDNKSIKKAYKEFLDKLANRKAQATKNKLIHPLTFRMSDDLGLPIINPSTNLPDPTLGFVKQTPETLLIKKVAEKEVVPVLDKIADLGLGKRGFSLLPNYGKGLAYAMGNKDFLVKPYDWSFSVYAEDFLRGDVRMISIAVKEKSEIKEHLFHELGHQLEESKNLTNYSRNYVDSRVPNPTDFVNGLLTITADGPSKIITGKELGVPKSSFKFPYAAKDYRHEFSPETLQKLADLDEEASTEAISVGLENTLSSADHFLNFARGDREHLLYTLHAITKSYE